MVSKLPFGRAAFLGEGRAVNQAQEGLGQRQTLLPNPIPHPEPWTPTRIFSDNLGLLEHYSKGTKVSLCHRDSIELSLSVIPVTVSHKKGSLIGLNLD